jgi:hypothetical protein
MLNLSLNIMYHDQFACTLQPTSINRQQSTVISHQSTVTRQRSSVNLTNTSDIQNVTHFSNLTENLFYLH